MLSIRRRASTHAMSCAPVVRSAVYPVVAAINNGFWSYQHQLHQTLMIFDTSRRQPPAAAQHSHISHIDTGPGIMGCDAHTHSGSVIQSYKFIN